MINKNRIVPITKVDFLTLVGIILKIANVSTTVIVSKDVEGTFEVTGSGAAGNKLADTGDYPLASGGELYAEIASLKNGKAKVVLKGVHHMSESRLGVTKLLRRRRKAAKVNSGKQRFVFRNIHLTTVL